MKTYKPLILMAICSFCLTSHASAEEAPSYSYLDLSYSNLSADDNTESLDGFGIKASFDLGNNLFVQGNYENIESDIDIFSGGLGYYLALSPNSNLFVRGDVVHVEVLDFSDTGYGLGVGLRAMLAPNVELAGEYKYTDIDDDDSSTVMGEARYNLTHNFNVGAGYETELDSDLDRWIFSGRLAF